MRHGPAGLPAVSACRRRDSLTPATAKDGATWPSPPRDTLVRRAPKVQNAEVERMWRRRRRPGGV